MLKIITIQLQIILDCYISLGITQKYPATLILNVGVINELPLHLE